MKLLFIEDNAGFATEVERAVRPIQDCELVWARSRDSAHRELAAGPFDLVLLDRRIPSADEVLDDHADHGWTVFQSIRTQSSGTPVWFLTGTVDSDFAVDINNDYGRHEDLHGRRVSEQMYQVFWKKSIADCVRRITEFAANCASLERIVVQPDPSLHLTIEETRTVRIFARRYQGAIVELRSLNGGLSNSRVLEVVVKTPDRRTLVTAAAKVSPLPETTAEALRYGTHISRLTPGGFPQLIEKVDAGAGNTGGLFYGMVGDRVENQFDRIAARQGSLSEVPPEICEILRPWYKAKTVEQIQIAQIRRKFISDIVLHQKRDELQGIETLRIENRLISAALCCQHGDLHCANVVSDGRGRAMLIDFGDTGPSYAAVDPVTLELSTVFHSERRKLSSAWPSEENMLAWSDVGQFTINCEFPSFVSACRDWANAEAGSPEEVIAVAYAYGMRQLKYPDTDKLLARALIRGCIEALQ